MIKKIMYSMLIFSIMAFTIPPTETDSTSINIPLLDAEKDVIEPCFMENKTFQGGEEITYKLYYNWGIMWLSAGEVSFKVNDMGSQYHVAVAGRTYKSYEWFFKVRDYYDTYIDKNSLLPKTAIRNVREGKYRLYDEITFDQENKKASSLRGKTKDVATKKNYNLGECMHDMLSVIYYSRNIDFESYKEGEEFPVKIFMDKEVWPLNVKYKGKQSRKKVKGKGRFNTIKFSPQVVSGRVFKEGEEMMVYVSDDKNRIPLLIESPVSVGSVKAVLKNYKGLKYNMTAKN
ncbi:MAG: DUF3108 domain-containing protein [Saprospiraceae bacterium]|nr:DUF3108 domain-containing protein [Saprospiraceae bacterium]MDG2420060.1 DUF3108 domain-containing protein [Saprospiraceae bacterium]